MTMLTIIISSVVLLEFGVSGRTGMFFVMAIAGMVCTALSVSGQTITDLKTGYWLGSTPPVQERVKFLGVDLLVGGRRAGDRRAGAGLPVRRGRARATHRQVLASPQASIMKALVEGFMSRQPVAYVLFAAGGFIAVAMEMLQVPPLIVALGMYLPLELNTPALVGGVISHYVHEALAADGRRRRPDDARARRHHRLGAHGGRGAGRGLRRGAAPLRVVPGGPDQAAVLRQRSGLADRQRRGVRSSVRLPVARSR